MPQLKVLTNSISLIKQGFWSLSNCGIQYVSNRLPHFKNKARQYGYLWQQSWLEAEGQLRSHSFPILLYVPFIVLCNPGISWWYAPNSLLLLGTYLRGECFCYCQIYLPLRKHWPQLLFTGLKEKYLLPHLLNFLVFSKTESTSVTHDAFITQIQALPFWIKSASKGGAPESVDLNSPFIFWCTKKFGKYSSTHFFPSLLLFHKLVGKVSEPQNYQFYASTKRSRKEFSYQRINTRMMR